MYRFTSSDIPKDTILYPILKHELTQSLQILDTIKPVERRQKRSINSLGTAWKFIAGSPDHEDLDVITKNLNEINNNNNKQVLINNIFNEKINNISMIVNNLLNNIRKDTYIENETIINLQNRIRLIKEELINIKYAIQWAKKDILNTLLLNKNEIEIALENLENDEIPFKNAEEALEISNINVISQNMTIFYMVKIPLTIKENFQKIIIRPVVKQNKIIINVKFDKILKGTKDTYGIKEECNNYKKIEICKQTQLVNISNSSCIPRVVNSLNSSCTVTNGQHIQQIEELKPGTILLNGFQGVIDADGMQKNLSGTHLVNFHNSTLKINNQFYINYDLVPLPAIPAVLQPAPIERNRVELLSLQALKEFHIDNIRRINLLKAATISNSSLSLGAVATIILGLIFFRKFWRKHQNRIIISSSLDLNQMPPANIDPKEIKDLSSDQNTYINFNNLPYF
uniref:Retrovirus-related Env polyprotein from transposon gypsy n=1 Tax=Bactrocera dorsalis TaxID=27457 RepID=A0A034WGH6_BACDO